MYVNRPDVDANKASGPITAHVFDPAPGSYVDGVRNYTITLTVTDADSDDDQLSDRAEITIHFTDPTIADTDDGGRDDGQEVMLGPSTPMVAEAFKHIPVHMLAGTVPIDKENVLKAIRHGMGTPVLQKFSRKSYLSL